MASTARDLAAFCELLDTMAEWCEQSTEGASLVESCREALSAVRVAVALRTDETAARVNDACATIADEKARGLKREFLGALFLVARGAIDVSPTPAQINAAERLLLTHATNAGTMLGVKDAAREARMAIDRGRTSGRKADRYPEPGFAQQLALGALLAQYRELGRMSPDALCTLASSKGVKITRASLARMEGGTASKEAPLDAVVVCLGHDPKQFRARAAHCHNLARELAKKVSGTDSERWFGEFVAIYGDRGARSTLSLAACAAAGLDEDKLR